jgi:hypothetical protein
MLPKAMTGLTDDEGEKTFENEDPLPWAESAKPLHLNDTTGEKPTKSTGGGGCGEKDSHPQTALVTPIPH